VLAATGFSAVSVASLQTAYPEHKASVVAAVGALVSRFQLSDLNPLRWIYDYEVGEITSPSRKLDFPTSPPVVVSDPLKWTPMDISQLGPGGAMKNGSFAGVNGAGSLPLHSRPAVRCGRFGVTLPCE